MPISFEGKLVVATSSRALFDLSESHNIYNTQGLDAYRQYQIEHEDVPLNPGEAFPLVKKLLAINEKLPGEHKVEVILLSRNSADTGLRVFNSMEHWKLPITRAAFSGGKSPYRYVEAFGAHLFISTNAEDVRNALELGYAAASIIAPTRTSSAPESTELKIAFDGDAVLFSDESEQVYQSQGLEAFAASERAAAKTPMRGGPFKPFLQALHNLQSQFSEDSCPIRTALVTARSAPAHERVVRTLRDWNIRIDESLFLGGLDKGVFLKAFGADVFFDDQEGHCLSASQHVAAGHVPHGIVNKK
ncbi:MAG: 5'-nucleotidase [Gammaproteobacteria bacterium]|nr:5'-nucleotidase [Gammaproteobacteria bacterium]